MQRVLFLLSLPLLCSAASITYSNGANFTTTSPTLGTPIQGFDASLGRFESATAKLVLMGGGSFGYYCPGAPDSVTCGDWEWDPGTQEWVLIAPRPYTGSLPWHLDVSSEVYDTNFSRYWSSGGGFDFNGRCDDFECYWDATVMIEETTADPVFGLSKQLYWDLRTDMLMHLEEFSAGGYAPTAEASYSGEATLQITYTYTAVPEPSVAPICVAAFLALALRRLMVSEALYGRGYTLCRKVRSVMTA